MSSATASAGPDHLFRLHEHVCGVVRLNGLPVFRPDGTPANPGRESTTVCSATWATGSFLQQTGAGKGRFRLAPDDMRSRYICEETYMAMYKHVGSVLRETFKTEIPYPIPAEMGKHVLALVLNDLSLQLANFTGEFPNSNSPTA